MDERKAFVEWARQVRVWDVDPPEAVLMAWKAATLAERERAAKVCEEHPEGQLHPRLAAAIRKG